MKMTQPKIFARDGKLYISYSFNRKQIRKSLNMDDTKANRHYATTQIIPQYILKVHSGELFNNTKIPTVDEFIKVSFKIHEQSRKTATQDAYLQMYNKHIKPRFGNKKLNCIKPSEISLWQNTLCKSLSPKTVKTIRTILYTIYSDAIKDELIEKNPLALVNAPVDNEVKEKIPFTLEEINKILKNSDGKMKVLFAIGFYTGMRTGEIIALKWSDIDFDKKTINIKRSIRKGIESVPKTKTSVREIEILDVLLPYLIDYHKSTIKGTKYLFETSSGRPYASAEKISTCYWKRLLKQLDIPYRILYQMRHTFASMMIGHGEDILWVSNMLGHKDSSITLQKYARYIAHEKVERASFLTKLC